MATKNKIQIPNYMNTKLFSKLTINSLAALGIVVSGAMARANATNIRETETQIEMYGPSPTDFSTILTFDSFDETSIPLAPNEIFSDYNSLHIGLEGTAFFLPGDVICIEGDNNGRCTGTVESEIEITLLIPEIFGIELVQIIPSTTIFYDVAEGDSSSIPGETNTEIDEISFDLLAGLPNGLTEAEIQTVLDYFDASIVGPFVDLDVFVDGTVLDNRNTGLAIVALPLVSAVEVSLFYDYTVETACCIIPEPGNLLGLAFIVTVGLLAKGKKL